MQRSKKSRTITAEFANGEVMFFAMLDKALLNQPRNNRGLYVNIMARPRNITAGAVKVGQMEVNLNECRVESVIENSRGPKIGYDDVVRFHMEQQMKTLYGDLRPKMDM